MPCSEEDKVLIKNLEGYGPRRLMTELPEKNWKRGGLEKFDMPDSERGAYMYITDSQSSVICIAHRDLDLKCLKRRRQPSWKFYVVTTSAGVPTRSQ